MGSRIRPFGWIFELSGSGPRTRVRRLWLLQLSPDQIHASPLREPLRDNSAADREMIPVADLSSRPVD